MSHDVFFRLFNSKSDCRKSIGHEIDPKNLDRRKNRPVEHRHHKQRQHLAQIGRQKVLNGFLNVGKNFATFFDSDDDGCKIVIRKNDVRRIFGSLCSGDAHADADICLFQCWCVIDAVARHGHDFAACLPGFDDADFVFRGNAGVNRVLFNVFLQF